MSFWKKWLDYNIYKKLWSVVGGRPWTYIYRDVWHKFEWFPQMQWLVTGAIGYYFGGWKGLLIAVGIYTFGYINGHFFWGKKYVAEQQGK